MAPPREAGWPAAIAQLDEARRARRARDFSAALVAVDAALALRPRYKLAHLERGKILLDAGLPSEALQQLTLLFALQRTWPDLLAWLVRATAATRRLVAIRAPSATQPGCEVVHVGRNRGPEKILRDAVSSPDVRCPTAVSKANWLGDDDYDDAFAVAQDGRSLTVRREAEHGVAMAHGWGMDLQFVCCEGGSSGDSLVAALPVSLPSLVAARSAPTAAGDDKTQSLLVARLEDGAGAGAGKAAAARWASPDHYVVLGVPCDFTADELKRAYRVASLQAHPDKAGGSSEAFARVAAAHQCLADSERCRPAFDRGEDLAANRAASATPLTEEVERQFFPSRFPYQPFGDPFAHDRP